MRKQGPSVAFLSECHPAPYIPTGSSSKQASDSLSISMQVPGPPSASLSYNLSPNSNINQPTTAHASIVSQPAAMLGPAGASTAPPVAPSNISQPAVTLGPVSASTAPPVAPSNNIPQSQPSHSLATALSRSHYKSFGQHWPECTHRYACNPEQTVCKYVGTFRFIAADLSFCTH